MKVECVHCGASGQMDESKIPPNATSINCPRCKKSFPIPMSEASSKAAPPEEVLPEEARSFSAPAPAMPAPAQPAPARQAPFAKQANCSVCNCLFPQDEMARFGASWVCAACKPGYVQMLAQGKPRPGEVRYAGFGIRFGAKFLDGLILGAVSLLISAAVGFLLPKSSPKLIVAASGLTFILQTCIYAAYSGYFLHKNRATPGKMACGLEVILPGGGQISFMRGVGRYFAELLSSVILGIGYLMVLFDAEKRSLHDRICDTRVVYR
jgi:predicted Zn finger-like uncharacterized protein